MRFRQRTPGPPWTPEDLARVHGELEKVACDVGAVAWQGQQGAGPGSVVPLSASADPAGEPPEFDLHATLRELWDGALAARSELPWTIATPAMLLGLMLCCKPLGLGLNAIIGVLTGIALISFCVAALWEALTRTELSCSLPSSKARLEPYWRFDEQRFLLVRNLGGLAVGIYVYEFIGISLATFLNGIFWPLSVVFFLLTWLGVACALFYGIALVANEHQDASEALGLLWPPDGRITLGAMIALVPAMLAAGVIRLAFASIDAFSYFNPVAAIGLAGLLFSLVPLSKYFAAIYRRVSPGKA